MAPDLSLQIIPILPALRRHALRVVAARPEIGTADDFVQDTVVTALQIRDRFGGGNLGGWLYAILQSHIRNAGRRARIGALVPLAYAQDEDGREIEHDAIVEPIQEAQVASAQLVRALGVLPEKDQRMVRLPCFEEWSYAQIAAELERPLGTVKSRLSRALARLRAACAAAPHHLCRRSGWRKVPLCAAC